MVQRVTRAIVALFTIACSSSGPTLEPLPQQSDGSATPAPPRTIPGRWVLVPDHSSKSYISSVMALLELHSDGTTVRDSVATSIDFTISVALDQNPPKFTGIINKVSVQTGNRIEQPNLPSVLPFPFAGHLENGKLLIDSTGKEAVTDPTRCTSSAAGTLTSIQRNFIVPPAVLTTGLSWTDSVTIPGCSGSIPIILSTKRSYHVTGETSYNGRRVLLVQRTEETEASGEGSQGQHRVTLNSRGSGTANMHFNSTTGDLVGLQGEQRSQVEVTSSGRVQKFTQIVREKTDLIPER